MKVTATPDDITAVDGAVQPGLATRRSWLKGLSALLGTGLLAAPAGLLAGPVAAAGKPQPASALVGGEEYIGMVKLLAGHEVPVGWALCHGQLLSVQQHAALFVMLGTTYGGDGRTTFALPDLRESVALPVMAAVGAAPGAAAPAPVAGGIFAIKTVNAPATTTGLAELRLRHHARPRRATA